MKSSSRRERMRSKQCEHCNETFEKPFNEPWGRWDKRRFCSHQCWWSSRPNWNRYAK